jgi:hypothetical protein
LVIAGLATAGRPFPASSLRCAPVAPPAVVSAFFLALRDISMLRINE